MSKIDDKHLLMQLDIIAKGLSETFSPFCEIVVHDLGNHEHAILAIHNNLSGREIGDPATELGIARILSSEFPNIIANYANQFTDGRPVKSTSIGIKGNDGNYIAALCINIDLTLFQGMQNMINNFTQVNQNSIIENLNSNGQDSIKHYIDHYASAHATTPRLLKANERKEVIIQLKQKGLLDIKKSMEIVAQYLGISRASAYLYAKEE